MDSPPPFRARLTVPRPIVVVGAGGIVRDAHLPAYRLAGLPVAALVDLDLAKAQQLAAQFGVPAVHPTLADAVRAAPANAVFDVAVPASSLPGILSVLPDGTSVLVQKPFGENLVQARDLLALCRRKALRAAVNFQLRYAPAVVAARALIAKGDIGVLHDVEIRVNVLTPWQLWTFLEASPRVEILYHSIHYVDLIRSFLGDPSGVLAKTVRSPSAPKLADTRSSILLDYGHTLRATITTNHGHDYGPRHQESYIKWEGSRGAIKAGLGLLLDYPRGQADTLEICRLQPGNSGRHWEPVPLGGNWFPHAFIGPMTDLQRQAAGELAELPTRVEDAVRTMAVVEAAYESSRSGSTPIPYL